MIITLILKGGPGSGWYAPPKGTHMGAQRGAAVSGGLAKKDDTELYRWVNLAEIVDAERGRLRTSLDMTDKADFYFAPPTVLPKGSSWVTKVYGRAIFDRDILQNSGWGKDPVLKVEGAWRWKPANLGGTWRDFPFEFPLKGYLEAFQGFEVVQIPSGRTVQDVKAILDYRLDRDVPVARGNLAEMTVEQ